MKPGQIAGASIVLLTLQLTPPPGSVLAGGFNPGASELAALYSAGETQEHARDWLTERGDVHARREQRLETVEWAILVFVIIAVIVDVVLLVRS